LQRLEVKLGTQVLKLSDAQVIEYSELIRKIVRNSRFPVRSAREITIRLRQELINLLLLYSPPNSRTPAQLPLALPTPPKQLPANFCQLAAELKNHRFPLLGLSVDTDASTPGQIRWRRDYISGRETELAYFRRIPYLDASRAGDHKVIWELNRHQHLVLLAQCGYIDEVVAQLQDWIQENPFHRGINWSSSLEVAFRALSWIWIYHLAGNHFPESFRAQFLRSVHQHGRHLENNLSFYFSPNTHLLGEAVALHALGKLFPGFPRARKWEVLGGRVVDEQIEKQVRPDGGHFEQSTYYHVYALDMFLFHAILNPPTDAYRNRLEKMVEYLHELMGPMRKLAFIGDDDGGRFFHPFGAHDEYGRATIATAANLLKRTDWAFETADLFPQAAWWLGNTEGRGQGSWHSKLFPDTGMAVMTSGPVHILIDAGPFGPWGSGHSHSDTLSLVVRHGEREILVDPGTYTYVGDIQERNRFRGTAAHNTIRIDALDQATPVNPFRWTDQPAVRILSWQTSSQEDLLDAECIYCGFVHRRRVRFRKPHIIEIDDEIAGPPGEHLLEQFWHMGSEHDLRLFQFDGEVEQLCGERSKAFGQKQKSPEVRICRKTNLPARFHTVIDLSKVLSKV
jgi:uncharacterized heparinase superfamily protein